MPEGQGPFGYRLMQNQAVQASNVEWLREQPDDQYDCTITSPPYGLNIDYDTYQDTQENLWPTIDQCLTEVTRVTRPGGRICVNVMPNTQHHLATHVRITDRLQQLGWCWITEIIWDKGMVPRWFPRGSWGSNRSPWYQHSHEYIIVMGLGSHQREYASAVPRTMSNDEYKQWTRPLWRIAPQHENNALHPAQFPRELVRRLILLNTQPGELILDPFGGIGNTLVESVREKRRCHSIDISAEYTRQAQRRLTQIELDQRLFDTD